MLKPHTSSRRPWPLRFPATATGSRCRTTPARLHVSGQVGVSPEGKVLEGAEAQIEQAWRNVLSVLEAAGMGPRDLVKVTTFLVNRADLATARAVRERMLQGAEAGEHASLRPRTCEPPAAGAEIEAIAAAA